jgi:hypothetical protein
MRIFSSRYVDFMRLPEDIPIKLQSLDSDSRRKDSRISIAKQCDSPRTSKPSPFCAYSRFAYIGIDPKNANTQELLRLENANAAVHFENDPYACTSPVLAGKRLMRNPFRRMHGYGATNPALLNLLSWCPESGAKDRWFDRTSLPWDHRDL